MNMEDTNLNFSNKTEQNLNINTIAKIAGVSRTTISRVINNKPDVSPETRESIKDIIDKLGYQPNANAKAISQRRINNIGLIIPYEAEYIFSNPFYVDVMQGISTKLDEKGYYLVLCYPHEQNYLDIYKQKRVDGFILLSPGICHKTLLDQLIEKNVPFISTSSLNKYKTVPSVDIDNYLGGQMATEHLISLGHKRIAFIGQKSLASNNERLCGFRDILKRHKIKEIEEMMITTASPSMINGYEAAKKLLDSGSMPTAIFVVGDIMAFGAIKACHEKKLKIPDDISIIGFDNLAMGAYIYPSLTTINQPAFEKGLIAAEMIIEYLRSKVKPKSVTLSVELVIRKSTVKI